MATTLSLSIEEYPVGVVCARSDEMSAAIAILDPSHHPVIGQDKLDPDSYMLGRTCEHNVVIVPLPSSLHGIKCSSKSGESYAEDVHWTAIWNDGGDGWRDLQPV
jgi:hypothetical protein